MTRIESEAILRILVGVTPEEGDILIRGPTSWRYRQFESLLPSTPDPTEPIAPTWNNITGKPSTFPPDPHSHTWTQITGKPAYATRWPSFDEVTDKPTTLAGYGITDAYTQDEVDTLLDDKSDVGHLHDDRYSQLGHTHSFASLTDKPTTLSGYGITDAYTKTEVDGFLGDKADDNAVVKLAGSQTITGIKTFTARPQITISGEDEQLLRFNSERAWHFKQVYEGGSSGLALKSEVSGKPFEIRGSDDEIAAAFFVSTSGNVVRLVHTGSSAYALQVHETSVRFSQPLVMDGDTILTTSRALQNIVSVNVSGTRSDTINTGYIHFTASGTGHYLQFGQWPGSGGSSVANSRPWIQSGNSTTPAHLFLQPFGGNVGIGYGHSVSPSELLDVAGNIRAEAYQVGTSVIITSSRVLQNVTVADPTADQQIASKKYVDDNIGGGGGAVDSVFGRTGEVVANGEDYEAFYSLLGHDHDDSYYTKIAIDSLLDDKADDISVVKLAGTQTIGGAKTFTARPTIQGAEGLRTRLSGSSNPANFGATGFHSTGYIASNLRYVGSGDPQSAANWRYELSDGGAVRGGAILLVRANSNTDRGVRIMTAPESTGADDTPIGLTMIAHFRDSGIVLTKSVDVTPSSGPAVLNVVTPVNEEFAALDLLEGATTGFGNSSVFGFRLEYEANENVLYLRRGNGTTTSNIWQVGRDSGDFILSRGVVFNGHGLFNSNAELRLDHSNWDNYLRIWRRSGTDDVHMRWQTSDQNVMDIRPNGNVRFYGDVIVDGDIDVANVVLLSGAQTIAGVKTFTGVPIFSGGRITINSTGGSLPGTPASGGRLGVRQVGGSWRLEISYQNGNHYTVHTE